MPTEDQRRYEQKMKSKNKVKTVCQRCGRTVYAKQEVYDQAQNGEGRVLCKPCSRGCCSPLNIDWNLSFDPYHNHGLIPKGSHLPLNLLAPLMNPF